MKDKKTGMSLVKPVEILDNADKLTTRNFVDEFGDSAFESAMANVPHGAGPGVETGLQAVINTAKELMLEREMNALSRLDILKEQTDSLGRCVFLASQIYENAPIPDHAYQLSALASAFNASLAQVDKMNDPVQTYNQMSELVESMFREFVSKMAFGIDRVKKELCRQNPEMANAINAHFERMLREMSPDTSDNYDKFRSELRKILGIRQRKPGQGADPKGSKPTGG